MRATLLGATALTTALGTGVSAIPAHAQSYWAEYNLSVTEVGGPPPPSRQDLFFRGYDLVNGYTISGSDPIPEFGVPNTYLRLAAWHAGGIGVPTSTKNWLLNTTIAESDSYLVGSKPDPAQILGSLLTAPTLTYGTQSLTGFKYYSTAWEQITIPSPLAPQLVYLDFGANANARFNLDSGVTGIHVGYLKPDSGLTATQISSVVANANAEYENYNLSFTTTQPSKGDYHTIYVGGTFDNVTAVNPNLTGILKAGVLGLAQRINVLDNDRSLSAVVFSDLFNADTGLLSQVIEHEAGHLLGLEHVVRDSELMYPYAGVVREGISSTSIPVGYINGQKEVVPTPLPYTQNSDADLRCGVSEQSCANADYKGVAMYVSSFSTIYDGQVVAITNTGSDTGDLVYSIGTILPNTEQTFYLPQFADEKFVFMGSSIEGDDPDIFLGGPSGFEGDLSNYLTFANPLYSDSGNFALSKESFYKEAPDGSFTPFGFASFPDAVVGAPEPSTWAMMLLGFAGLGFAGWRGRRKTVGAAA